MELLRSKNSWEQPPAACVQISISTALLHLKTGL